MYSPNLPDKKVKAAAVSSQFPDIIAHLEAQHISCIPVPPCGDLAAPVAAHADMLVHPLEQAQVVVYPYDDSFTEIFHQYDIKVIPAVKKLDRVYPNDIALNYCRLGKYLFGNFQDGLCEPAILEYVSHYPVQPIHVPQGYAKCSTCIVDEQHIITADHSIADAMESVGICVLRIESGYIQLDGYDTGFIGGCCGKIDKDMLYFTGKLSSHPNGIRMRQFIQGCDVKIMEYSHPNLIDIGGIIPLA